MGKPDRLCTCPPRERAPYKDSNTCFRCGGEIVGPPMEAFAPVVELRRPEPDTSADVDQASRDAIAVLTAAINEDMDEAARIVTESETPEALAVMVAAYGSLAWMVCKKHGLDVDAALQELALEEARSS